MSWAGTEFHDELNRAIDAVIALFEDLPFDDVVFCWIFSEFLDFALTCGENERRQSLERLLLTRLFDHAESLAVPDYSDYVVWGDERPEPPAEEDRHSVAMTILQVAESLSRTEKHDVFLRSIIRAGADDPVRFQEIHAFIASMGIRSRTHFDRLIEEETSS